MAEEIQTNEEVVFTSEWFKNYEKICKDKSISVEDKFAIAYGSIEKFTFANLESKRVFDRQGKDRFVYTAEDTLDLENLDMDENSSSKFSVQEFETAFKNFILRYIQNKFESGNIEQIKKAWVIIIRLAAENKASFLYDVLALPGCSPIEAGRIRQCLDILFPDPENLVEKFRASLNEKEPEYEQVVKTIDELGSKIFEGSKNTKAIDAWRSMFKLDFCDSYNSFAELRRARFSGQNFSGSMTKFYGVYGLEPREYKKYDQYMTQELIMLAADDDELSGVMNFLANRNA